jgi:uncharacterized protein (DUF1697 family)
MPRFIAFLRAINVGGRNVKMNELQALFAAAGMSNVETFIASGNVIFESSAREASLRSKLEKQLQQALGYEVVTFIRSDGEVAAIATYQAFPAARLKSAGAFCVALLGEALSPAAIKALAELTTEIDEFHVNGREVYWLCKVGQSQSKFSNAVFERKLKVPATFRGFNTIVRLAAKYPPRAVR